MFVVYVERIMIDRFKAIDRVHSVNLERTFIDGGLLYGYIDRYNVKTIDTDMIISIDGKPGAYKKRHGSYTEITDNF